jgi:hypothetical protein
MDMSDEQRTYYKLTLGQGIAVDEQYDGEAEVEERKFKGSDFWDKALIEVSEKANAVIFIGDTYATPLGTIHHPTQDDRDAAVPGRFYYSFQKGNKVNATDVKVIKLENLSD